MGLKVGRDGMLYGRWVVAWGVGKGELRLDKRWLADGAGVYVCFNLWCMFGWKGTAVVFSGRCWDFVEVEEWFW